MVEHQHVEKLEERIGGQVPEIDALEERMRGTLSGGR